MFFDGNDFDFGMPIVPEEITFFKEEVDDEKEKLVSTKEGFLRGNMFAELYDPYKDMTYLLLKPKNERESLMYKIMEYDFAINDLNLYLDLNPENNNMYEKFKMYIKKCMELKDEYSKKYGPLTIEQVDSSMYKWEDNPWPWEDKGGSMYV